MDIDLIFASMDLGDIHLVALSIDLRSGVINIFYSNDELVSNSKVSKELKPVQEIMLVLVNELCPLEVAGYTPASRYTLFRPAGVSQSSQAGDAGPMAVKFIELREQGLPVTPLIRS